MEKRKCLRQKCGVEFTPTKPKQKYCSTKCRTYAHRESLKNEEEKVEEPKKENPKTTPVTPKNEVKEEKQSQQVTESAPKLKFEVILEMAKSGADKSIILGALKDNKPITTNQRELILRKAGITN